MFEGLTVLRLGSNWVGLRGQGSRGYRKGLIHYVKESSHKDRSTRVCVCVRGPAELMNSQ